MALLAFFLSNYILPQENGALSIYSVFVSFVIPFVILGMPSSMILEHTKLSVKEYKTYFSSALALSSISFFILLIVFLVAGNLISGFMTVPFRFLLFGMFYTYFNLFQENVLAYLRVLNKPVKFLIISAIKDLLEVSLVLVLVVHLGMSAEGRIIASVSAIGGMFIFGLILFYKDGLINTNISVKFMKTEFKFGISQVFFQFNVFLLNATDKFMINYFNPHDKTDLGIYSMANQFAFIINVLIGAFFFTYQPILYKFLADFTPENKLKMLRIKYIFAGFLLLCTILLCAFIPLIYHLLINKQYHPGIPYVAWLAFSYFFWGLYALMLGFLYYYKKNRTVILFSVYSAVICILLDYFFIKYDGVMGAAHANLIMYALLFVSLFITVNRVCDLKLPWLKLGAIFKSMK